jgi:hypothetical protein
MGTTQLSAWARRGGTRGWNFAGRRKPSPAKAGRRKGYDVYLSYRVDGRDYSVVGQVADNIVFVLGSAGLSVFSHANVLAGERLEQALVAAGDAAAILIVLIDRSGLSEFQKMEVTRAIDQMKPVVPVLVGGATPAVPHHPGIQA